MLYTYILFIVVFSNVSFSARILGVLPTPSYNIQLQFQPLWEELAEKGHNVTLITGHPVDNTNVRQIPVGDIQAKWNSIKPDNLERLSGNSILRYMEVFRWVIQLYDIRKLLQYEEFDVVLVDFSSPIWTIFGYHFKCPLIGLLPFDVDSVHSDLGNPTNPSIYADFNLQFGLNINVFEKIINLYYGIFLYVYKELYMYDIFNKYILQYYGKTVDIKTLYKTVDMLFINSIPGFHKLRPVGSNTIYIGGRNNSYNIGYLKKDMVQFLDSSQQCIYVNIYNADLYIQNKIIGILAKLPFNIIWNSRITQYETFENIMFVKDVPELSILEHPNVKLLITDGNAVSLEHALYSQVPIIAIPTTIDEIHNAEQIKEQNIGLYLNSGYDINDGNFNEIIQEILKNKQYAIAIKSLSNKVLDQPHDGIEKAVWWTEYVIRHKKIDHFKNPSLELRIYEIIYADIVITISFFIILSYIILFNILAIIINFVTILATKKEKII